MKNYDKKINNLRQLKIEHTKEKLYYEGYLDEDDYGRIVPTFEWNIIPNSYDNSFYNINGWCDNFCSLMDKHDTFINKNDAFTGRWMYFMSKMRPVKFKEELIDKDLKKEIDKYCIDASIGFDAHFCPDYKIGLDLGFKGLLDKIEKYRKINTQKNESLNNFYDCHKRVILSIQNWIKKHILELDKIIELTDNIEEKAEYKIKKSVNENILNNKPENLREVLQWIIWFHLASRTFNRDGAGGQLDTLLQPYYENDIKNNILNDDEAIYLLSCFLINDPIYWQIGGPDQNNKDQSSKISYLILDAADKINTTLNITFRVHENMDKKLFDKAVNLLIKNKNAWPRFSGDEALVKGFSNLGYSKTLARERIAVGCNWMSLPGLEYTLNDLFKVNLLKVFEISFSKMMKKCGYPSIDGDIGTYIPVIKGSKIEEKLIPSIDLLFNIYTQELEKAVSVTASAMLFHLSIQKENEVELLLNLLSHGPIEKGLDISDGGAQYYNLAIDGSALGSVADCFNAIEQRIDVEKKLSYKDLNYYIRTNWSSQKGELTRSMMLNSNHYGQGGDADNWAIIISKKFSEFVRDNSIRNYQFIPGLFSWAKSHIYGRDVGATANGRRFGDPITHGANPIANFSKDCNALSQSNAIAKVQPPFGNTAPLQIELDISSFEDNSTEIVKSIILAHFEKGGTLININIIDKKVLLKANENPQDYPNLVVRVTGFTAYFCMLSPEFRQLVVDRVLLK